MVPIPETDLFLAKRRRLLFYVTGKDRPRGNWRRVIDAEVKLDDAMVIASRNLGMFSAQRLVSSSARKPADSSTRKTACKGWTGSISSTLAGPSLSQET